MEAKNAIARQNYSNALIKGKEKITE